tara:strand:- start:220 stop:735 length:516 start_codon:yes stop_codon:yes gene_type:complete
MSIRRAPQSQGHQPETKPRSRIELVLRANALPTAGLGDYEESGPGWEDYQRLKASNDKMKDVAESVRRVLFELTKRQEARIVEEMAMLNNLKHFPTDDDTTNLIAKRTTALINQGEMKMVGNWLWNVRDQQAYIMWLKASLDNLTKHITDLNAQMEESVPSMAPVYRGLGN